MANYTYFTPTKLYIEEDILNVGKIIKDLNYQKVLVIYGTNSVKKMGLDQKVIKSLEENNLEYLVLSGVEANPKLSFVRKALTLDFDFDFILAIGGGSVIDTAKSLAASKKMGVDPWVLNSHQEKVTAAYPLGAILTIAAAGSEMSDSCVITNEETKEKKGFNSDLVRPVFAIMNPELTYSVSKYQTACGIVDIMMHTLERYLHEESDDLADNLCIAILKTVYENGLKAYNNPTDFEARKNLMLASSFSHNGLTNLGRSKYFRCHQFEHILSGLYDNVSHGAGLSVCYLAYAKIFFNSPIYINKFARFGLEVLKMDKEETLSKQSHKSIEKLEDFFRSLGMPIKLKDLNIDDSLENLEYMSHLLTDNGDINDIMPIDYFMALEIFKLMV